MFDVVWTQVIHTSWIEWLGTAAGISGVWFSIREKIAAWPLFIVCYTAYTFISFHSGMYAATGMNVIFIGISIYGWLSWSRSTKAVATARQITRTPRQLWWIALAFWGSGTLVVGWILHRFAGNAYFPFVDAFAGCGALVAQWMLSRKYFATWTCWILANLTFLVLWIGQERWLTVGLYFAFTGLAVHGWIMWRRSLQAHGAPH